MSNYNEEKFDSFINKTIILSSKKYFERKSRKEKREKTILDNEDYAKSIQKSYENDNMNLSIEKIEMSLQIKNALNCLSDIEQTVLFLLYEKEMSQEDAAEILEIWSKSVSRIKLRAIEKLRKELKGDVDNEK